MRRNGTTSLVFLTIVSLCGLIVAPSASHADPSDDLLTAEEYIRSTSNQELPADSDFFFLSPEEEALYAPVEEEAEQTSSDEEPLPSDTAESDSADMEAQSDASDSDALMSDSQSGESAQSSELESESPSSSGESSFFKAQPGAVRELTVAAPFYSDADHYVLPGINGVQWIVNGELKNPGTHQISTEKQRQRLIISAWTADKHQFKLVGTTSWVLQPGTFAPASSSPTNYYAWEPRQHIGHGWSGRVFSAGNFDGVGGPDLFRITPQGQLILYPTFSMGRFSTPIAYGYGWDRMTKLATGFDFNGDATPDILAADTSGRLYLYPGNGRGSFKTARTAFGYGWDTFRHLALLPATDTFGPRLVATHHSGQMFVYEGNGRGGFKGGRHPLGFGWETMHAVLPAVDWNHDGHQDLLVVNRWGHLLLYPGNPSGYWGRGTRVGQGWTVMGTILSIADHNQNILWAVDRGRNLWHYKNSQNGHVSPTVNTNWGFNTSGYKTRGNAPYPYSHPGKWVGTAWKIDANNVPIVQVPSLMNGQRIYHPVAYSRFALDAIENYHGNKSSALANRELARAKATAQALVNGAIRDEDTLWFPYSFPYNALGHPENALPTPWYSSMSQGFALATFVRLSQATGDIKWRQYADMTFASYFARPHEKQWISLVDNSGNLWLEEYPGSAIPTKVLNGHLFSAESLQYYWLDTGNSTAEALIDGAVTAVVNEFDNYRTPGRTSLYCASIFCWRVQKNPADYHRIVANQLRDFGDTLNAPRLIQLAQALYMDH